jgi:hypothetical protein
VMLGGLKEAKTHQLQRRQPHGFGNDSTHPTPCSYSARQVQ